MKFKRVKSMLALGLAVTTFMSAPVQASAVGLKDIFNAKYYADTYADLKEAFGYDEDALYNHFLKYGLKENRNMNPVLDVAAYREAYADLEEAFGDNWDAYVDHFFTYGAYEKNRREGVLLDPIAYLESYGDLKEAFGDDLVAAVQHYQEYGYQEKRAEGTAKGYSDIAEAKQAEAQAAAAAAAEAQKNQIEQMFTGWGYTTMEYDKAGNLLKRVYRDYRDTYSYTDVYTYNSNNDQTGYWYYGSDGELVNYNLTDYDAQGRAVKSTSYDKDGKVTGYNLMEWNADATESKQVYYNADGVTYGSYAIRKHDSQKNIIQSVSYNSAGEVINVYNATYNDKKKILTYQYADADGNVREHGTNTYYSNGRLKESNSTWSNGESSETYDENGYMLSRVSSGSDYTSKDSYEYYSGGPVKKVTSEYTGKDYYDDKEYTQNSVSEYNQSGICIKRYSKTVYADGTGYEYTSTYNDEGNPTHYDNGQGYVEDTAYYESGAIKQVNSAYSDGATSSESYRDAGSYLEDWKEREKYLMTRSYCSADGRDKSEQTYNEDGSYISKNTYESSDGDVYVTINTFDAQHRLVRCESNGMVETLTYYESGALKEDVSIYESGSRRVDTYRDAGSYISDWQERESYLASSLWTSADGKNWDKTTYNEDGSYVKEFPAVNEDNVVDGQVTEKYDADGEMMSSRSTHENGDYDEDIYYPGGNNSIKTKTVHNVADDWYIVYTLKDAGRWINVWDEDEVRPYLITWEWIDANAHVVNTYHEDGSYTETVTGSDGTVEVKEYDANGNEIVQGAPAQGSVSDGDVTP